MSDRRKFSSPINGRKGGTPKSGVRRGPQPPHLATRTRALVMQQSALLDAEAVVEQIARGALYDPGDFLDADGHFKPLGQLTEAQRQCIAGIEFVMKNATAGDGQIDRVLRLKLVDRGKFVEMGAKYHSLLVDRLDANLNTQVTGQRLDLARQKAAQLAKARKP